MWEFVAGVLVGMGCLGLPVLAGALRRRRADERIESVTPIYDKLRDEFDGDVHWP